MQTLDQSDCQTPASLTHDLGRLGAHHASWRSSFDEANRTTSSTKSEDNILWPLAVPWNPSEIKLWLEVQHPTGNESDLLPAIKTSFSGIKQATIPGQIPHTSKYSPRTLKGRSQMHFPRAQNIQFNLFISRLKNLPKQLLTKVLNN